MTHRHRCRYIWRCLTLPLLLLPVEWVTAATEGSPAAPLISLTKLLGALALVLIVFWGFAWLIRRLQNPASTGASGLRIVGALSLGHRERLVVVQAGSDQLLLGVTASRIDRLHVLEDRLPDVQAGEAGDFRQKLAAALSRRTTS